MSRTLRFWPRRERERQRRVVALEQLARAAERLGRRARRRGARRARPAAAAAPRRPGGRRRLRVCSGVCGACSAAIASRRSGSRRADAQRRPAADRRSRRYAAGAARRARAARASRACARRRRRPRRRSCAGPPPPRPAPRARARRARGRGPARTVARICSSWPGCSVRARKPWLNQIAVATPESSRTAASTMRRLRRRVGRTCTEISSHAHRGLGADDDVGQRRHALGVVAPGPRRRLEQIAGGQRCRAWRARPRPSGCAPRPATARRSRSGAVRGLGRSRAGTANVIPRAGYEGRRPRARPAATASSSASTIVIASRLSTTAPTTALSGASASMNAPTAPSRTPRPEGKITVTTATIAPTALAPPR